MASSVPKFGAWNETDASSDAGYTMVFEKVRTEKKAPAANATPERSVSAEPVNTKKSSSGCSCFGLFKK